MLIAAYELCHFPGLWKTIGLILGVNKVAVYQNVKYPFAVGTQFRVNI